MQDPVVHALCDRRAQIRNRWEALLRLERSLTPLADPDLMVRLFDQTLDEIFHLMRTPAGPAPAPFPECECGRNPFLIYYRAAEQVLLEALVLVQAGVADIGPAERDAGLARVRAAVRSLAVRDIGAISGLCRHSGGGGPGATEVIPVTRNI